MTTIPMLQKELEQAYKDIKYYKNRIERLNNQLQQKENIIKEVREYIEKYSITYENEIEPYKDCDRTNNKVDNLEWCTASYNVKYSFKYGKAKSNFRKGGNNA